MNIATIYSPEAEYLNGFAYRDLGVGESFINVATNTCWFPHGVQGIADGQMFEDAGFDRAQMGRILGENYINLRAAGVDPVVAIKVAYIRSQIAQTGLISNRWVPATYNVNYLDCNTGANRVDFNADVTNAGGFNYAVNCDANFRNSVKDNLLNVICCLAYVFRTRAHHFTPDILPTYQKMYPKMDFNPAEWGLTIDQINVMALHCIPPNVLDHVWTYCVQNSHCSGTLVKRYNSPAAGTAAFFAARNSIHDLKNVVPSLIELHKDAVDSCEAICREYERNRWTGSINHKYYGVDRRVIDESVLGGLAALTISILTAFDPTAPMLQSPSLKRVSSNAPITTAVIGTALKTIVKSEKFAQKMLGIS